MRAVLLVFVLLALAVGAIGWWYARWNPFEQCVQRGLHLLSGVQTPTDVQAALQRWEKETGGAWRERQDALIEYLFAQYPLQDPRVRMLIGHVAEVDFGDRLEDWSRWHERAARARSSRRSLAGGSLGLQHRWRAPVGLTSWFSPIIVIDGQIYLGSLGSGMFSPADAADGVVRVNGADGASLLVFAAADPGMNDVVGLAMASAGPIVATREGMLYGLQDDGKIRWKTRLGAAPLTSPLIADVDRNGVEDAVVVTSNQRVSAIGTDTGRTVWSLVLPRPREASDAGGSAAAITLVDVLGSAEPEVVVVSPTGGWYVLSARDGRVRWQSGSQPRYSPVLISGHAPREAGASAASADELGRVWSLRREADEIHAELGWQSVFGFTGGVTANLRTLADGPASTPEILLCTAARAGSNDAVRLLAGEGLVWRVAPGGSIRATPAIADLNGDGETDIVVLSNEPVGDGKLRGVLSILTAGGQVLLSGALEAPAECSPVIADVDGDGQLELLVADMAGFLHCFSTRGFGPVEWGMFGGDPRNTSNAANAYSWGQTPFGFQRAWKPGGN